MLEFGRLVGEAPLSGRLNCPRAARPRRPPAPPRSARRGRL